MPDELRSFQAEAFDLWQKQGYRGIIKAVPGSGKTLAALEAVKKFDPAKNKKILIIVPTRPLLKQWTGLLAEFPNAEMMTINKARELTNRKVDLLVVDEIHRTTSEVNRRVYTGVQTEAILGLSATPNKDCEAYAGPVFLNVGFGQALEEDMIADFEVTFHMVDMTVEEKVDYAKLTNWISNAYAGKAEIPSWFMPHLGRWDRRLRQEYARYLAMQRRGIVYAMLKRIPMTIDLVKASAGKKILVFTQRIEHAKELAGFLNCDASDANTSSHPPRCVGCYHSKSKDDGPVQRFKTTPGSVLVTVRNLTEGFDVPDLDMVIVMSTAITEAYHIQTLGRAIRKCGSKVKEIHILIGKGTSDEDLFKYTSKYPKFRLVGEPSGIKHKARSPVADKYYSGEAYSLDHRGGVFRMNREGRVYFDAPPELAGMLRAVKHQGGKFTVGEDGVVAVKVGKDFIIAGRIEPGKIRPREERQRKLTDPASTYQEVGNKLSVSSLDELIDYDNRKGQLASTSFIYKFCNETFALHDKYYDKKHTVDRAALDTFYGQQPNSLRILIDTYAPEESALWDFDDQ